MTARDRKSGRKPSGRTSPARRDASRRPLSGAWVRAGILFALGALAAVAFALVRGRSHAPSVPLAAVDPARAYGIALELGGRGRHLAGVPYWHRALAGITNDSWEVRRNGAAILHNATLEVRSIGGRPLPASRASVERVTLAREALDQFGRAENLAPDPRTRAALLVARGELLEWWGLGGDALRLYDAALTLDPASAGARAHAAATAAARYGEPR